MLVSLAAPASLALGGCGGVVTSTTGDAAAADAATGSDTASADVGTADTVTPVEDAKAETCNSTPVKHDESTCSFLVDYPCGLPGGIPPTGLSTEQCQKLCMSIDSFSCFVDGRDSGSPSNVTINCQICAVGRRPAGLADESGRRASNDVGDFFARAAELETASIVAFRVLRDELIAFDAPATLVRDAERAVRDEIRHARAMTGLAKRHGGKPRKLHIASVTPRNLEQIAIENAVEGCVRETFGALVASHQAEHANDPSIARLMKKIAIDETRHAALAWSVTAWIETKLDEQACERVARARARAVVNLIAELDGPTATTLVETAGFPDTARARRLAEEMREMLWAA